MINIIHAENTTIFEVLIEEVDMYNVPELRAAITTALQPQPKAVILDLKEVRWLDSSAIGLLFLLQKIIKTYGGAMALAGLSGDILKVLQSLQAIRVFSHYANTTEAQNALCQNAA